MAVTTKKITTVDTATTFDDVFVNTNGTLRQVTKENFQQASGIATNTEDIATLNENPLINVPRKDSVDLNTLTTYGTYQCIRCTNAPTQSWGTLHVLPFGDNNENYLTQDFHMMSSNDVYRRYRDNGTWSAWVKLPTRSELDANTAAITALNSRTTSANGESITDMNTLKNTAIYMCDLLTANVQNAPPVGNRYLSGFLFVTNYSTNKTVQIFCQSTTSASSIYMRINWYNTWSNWSKFSNQSDIDALDARVTALENK